MFDARKTYIYARVSIPKQKPNLENQITILKQLVELDLNYFIIYFKNIIVKLMLSIEKLGIICESLYKTKKNELLLEEVYNFYLENKGDKNDSTKS